jgi:hypothetical protein
MCRSLLVNDPISVDIFFSEQIRDVQRGQKLQSRGVSVFRGIELRTVSQFCNFFIVSPVEIHSKMLHGRQNWHILQSLKLAHNLDGDRLLIQDGRLCCSTNNPEGNCTNLLSKIPSHWTIHALEVFPQRPDRNIKLWEDHSSDEWFPLSHFNQFQSLHALLSSRWDNRWQRCMSERPETSTGISRAIATCVRSPMTVRNRRLSNDQGYNPKMWF